MGQSFTDALQPQGLVTYLITDRINLSYVLFFYFRDLEDSTSLDESVENLDRGSLASFGSGNTTDSDKVSLIN